MRGRDLTTGAIPAHTWALAWPVMLSIFFQTLYQAVDAFWVSQLADEALAAVNMSQIALFASVSLTIGITVGSGVLMAMSIGARNIDEAERILGQSFVLNFIAAVVLTTLVLSLRTPILRAVGATDAIFPLARDYLTITGSAMVLIFLFFAAVFGFNSQGDNTTVTMLFAISTGLNIVLDPLLIFGWLGFPRLGVRGAAIATVISQVVLLASGITLLATRDMMVRFRFRRLVIRGQSVARVLAIGFPASLTSMMGPLAMAVLTAVVSRTFGDQGAVAVSVGLRAEVFSFLPAIGFGVAGLALIGQNMGAGNPERARRSYRTALVFALSFGTGLGILAVAFAGPIARTFTDDPVVIGYATRYLRSVPLSYGVMGAGMVVIMSFQGLRRSWRGAAVSALRLAVLSAAAILLAGLLGAPVGVVWLSVILANLVYAGVGYLALERQLARPIQPHGPPRPPEPDPNRDPAAARQVA